MNQLKDDSYYSSLILLFIQKATTFLYTSIKQTLDIRIDLQPNVYSQRPFPKTYDTRPIDSFTPWWRNPTPCHIKTPSFVFVLVVVIVTVRYIGGHDLSGQSVSQSASRPTNQPARKNRLVLDGGKSSLAPSVIIEITEEKPAYGTPRSYLLWRVVRFLWGLSTDGRKELRSQSDRRTDKNGFSDGVFVLWVVLTCCWCELLIW